MPRAPRLASSVPFTARASTVSWIAECSPESCPPRLPNRQSPPPSSRASSPEARASRATSSPSSRAPSPPRRPTCAPRASRLSAYASPRVRWVESPLRRRLNPRPRRRPRLRLRKRATKSKSSPLGILLDASGSRASPARSRRRRRLRRRHRACGSSAWASPPGGFAHRHDVVVVAGGRAGRSGALPRRPNQTPPPRASRPVLLVHVHLRGALAALRPPPPRRGFGGDGSGRGIVVQSPVAAAAGGVHPRRSPRCASTAGDCDGAAADSPTTRASSGGATAEGARDPRPVSASKAFLGVGVAASRALSSPARVAASIIRRVRSRSSAAVSAAVGASAFAASPSAAAAAAARAGRVRPRQALLHRLAHRFLHVIFLEGRPRAPRRARASPSPAVR